MAKKFIKIKKMKAVKRAKITKAKPAKIIRLGADKGLNDIELLGDTLDPVQLNEKRIEQLLENDLKIAKKLIKPKGDNPEETFPADFIEFADSFSKLYRKIELGVYKSNKLDFVIRYKELFTDAISFQTGVRVSHSTGAIEVTKNDTGALHYTHHFMFYSLLWCRAMYILKTGQTEAGDRVAMKYYATTGRPIKDVYVGLLATGLKNTNTELFQKRITTYFEILGK